MSCLMTFNDKQFNDMTNNDMLRSYSEVRLLIVEIMLDKVKRNKEIKGYRTREKDLHCASL